MYTSTPFRQIARIYNSIITSAASVTRLSSANEAMADRLGEVARSVVESNRLLADQAASTRALIEQFTKRPQFTGSNGIDIYDRLGLKLMLDTASSVDQGIIDSNSYEPEQIEYFFGLMKRWVGREELVFLDLGAYWGLYSLLAMKAGVQSIHAFDADRHNFAQLQAQIFLNNATGRIHPHFRAVSAEAGVLRCWDSRSHPDGNRGGVGVIRGSFGEGRPTHEVEAVAIDDYLSLHGKVIFIKLDVELHEEEALRGLARTLKGNRVVIQVEVLPGTEERIIPAALAHGLREIKAIRVDHYFTNMDDAELLTV